MEALASAVTPDSSRSPPATPPAVFTKTASSNAPPPVLGNRMRMGDRWKTSTIWVPFPEPLTTSLPEPSARCKSPSDGFPARHSGEPSALKSMARSDGNVASNIGLPPTLQVDPKGQFAPFQRTIVLVEQVAKQVSRDGAARPVCAIEAVACGAAAHRAHLRRNQNPANPSGLL
jgi:hypothetical protein